MNFNYDVAKEVSVSGRPANPSIAKVVAVVAGAPFALSLGQVIAVAKDAGIELPGDTTVRAWLQAAAERGEVARPTNRTYAPVGKASEAVEEAEAPVADEIETVADEATEAVDEDPLLGLDVG